VYFKLQKLTSQNLVNQAAVFCVRNALKVIYDHLRFENFSEGYTLDPGKGEGRKGRTEGKRRGLGAQVGGGMWYGIGKENKG
jgi:hypothetical protein